ncbi:MAG: hydantoinase B/oxoprolinase family protein [Chloroflexi bacterium]|nr:hydantoinase B/oxoprolinase family protein [Chloroflexota bacterium]
METLDPQTDPITLELVHHGLIAIVRDMRASMMRTAYSSIIYENQDFSCVIVGADGQFLAQTPADNPIHIFPIPWSVRLVLERFSGNIVPGDIFLHNDPFTGGTHLNDVTMICPVHLENRLFTFTVVRAHWGDVGGMTPGSISGQATEIYQEGLRIPTVRIYDGGKPNEAVLDLIFANVRGERERRGDFSAALTSCRQGARKVEAMAEKYGAETLRSCIALLLDRAEAQMRARIAAVPDGCYAYEAYVESTGKVFEPLMARLQLTIRGSELTADFSGSSPQCEGPMNAGPALAATGVFVAVKSYLDPGEDVNQGAWRPVHTSAPERTFLNARPPAACGGMSEVRYIVDTATMGALAAACPDVATGDNKGPGGHVYVTGNDSSGKLFIFYEYPAGGTAAWQGGDGNNACRHFQEGDFASIEPVEAIENAYPLIIERCEIRRDSAGAGRWRGGFGLRRDVRLLVEHGLLSLLTDRNLLAPHGVCGGYASAGNRYTVRRDGCEIEPTAIPGKVSGFRLQRDDVVIVRTAGGGGYGEPLERPPEEVLRDVCEGYLTVQAAQASYGVVCAASQVDAEATEIERAKQRAGRTYVTLALWSGPEYEGSRRVLRLAREIADRAGVGQSDVLELVRPQGAPLRAWAHVLDEIGDRAYVGQFGLTILGAQPGDRVRLRRLSRWGIPALER